MLVIPISNEPNIERKGITRYNTTPISSYHLQLLATVQNTISIMHLMSFYKIAIFCIIYTRQTTVFRLANNEQNSYEIHSCVHLDGLSTYTLPLLRTCNSLDLRFPAFITFGTLSFRTGENFHIYSAIRV